MQEPPFTICVMSRCDEILQSHNPSNASFKESAPLNSRRKIKQRSLLVLSENWPFLTSSGSKLEETFNESSRKGTTVH